MAAPIVTYANALDTYNRWTYSFAFYDPNTGLWDNGLYNDLWVLIGVEKTDESITESDVSISYNN